MHRQIQLVLVIFCLIASAAFSADLIPVAGDLVKGQTLTLASSNFKIDAPGNDWQWAQSKPSPPQQDIYFAVHSPTERILVLVSHNQATAIPADFLKGMQSGAETQARKNGFTIADFNTSASKVPFQGCYHYSYNVKRGQSDAVFFHGYIIPTGEIITLQAVSKEVTEPQTLNRMASSFQLIHPLEQRDAGSASEVNPLIQYLLAGALALGIAALINKISGRRMANGWKIAFVICALILLLNLGLTVMMISRSNLPPEKEGELIGVQTFGGAVALVICYLGVRRQGKTAAIAP